MAAIGKRIRVYADASVYGGAFDEEFDAASREFFAAVRAGRFQLVVSTVVRDELKEAPERVFRSVRGNAKGSRKTRMSRKKPFDCNKPTWRLESWGRNGKPMRCTWP